MQYQLHKYQLYARNQIPAQSDHATNNHAYLIVGTLVLGHTALPTVVVVFNTELFNAMVAMMIPIMSVKHSALIVSNQSTTNNATPSHAPRTCGSVPLGVHAMHSVMVVSKPEPFNALPLKTKQYQLTHPTV